MKWEFNNDRPIYAQIIEQMKLFIVSEKLKAGTKLPSVRELATEAEVNPNTMQKSLAELERSGLVYTNRTSGRFITEDNNMIYQVKQEIATESIQVFLLNMKKIGYDKIQTIKMIEKFEKGDENNE